MQMQLTELHNSRVCLLELSKSKKTNVKIWENSLIKHLLWWKRITSRQFIWNVDIELQELRKKNQNALVFT